MAVKVLLAELGENVRFDSTGGDANLLVSADGKTLSRTTGASAALYCRRLTRGRTTGKLFAAAQITAGSSNAIAFGLANELQILTGANSTLGASNNSWALLMGGLSMHQGVTFATGLGAFSVGHCILIALDFETGNLWFGKSTTLGGGFGITWANGGDPVAGTTPTFTNVARGRLDDGYNSLAALFLAGSCRSNNSGIKLVSDYATWRGVLEALPGYQIWGEFTEMASMDWCSQPTDTPPNRYYPGVITEESEPTYVRSARVFAWSDSSGFQAPFSGFEIQNRDGKYDWMMRANMRGLPVRFFSGDYDLPLVGMSVFGETIVDRMEPKGEDTIRIVCFDKLANMKRTVCPEVYDAALVPNAALAGQRKPFLAGPVDFVPLVAIHPQILEYQLADAELVARLGATPLLHYDAGVLITGGTVGWTFSSRADNFGMRRLTNPNAKLVASTIGRVGPRDSTFLDTTFPSWTGDNPNGWTITTGTETATRRFTQVAGPALGCQSDGTGTVRMSTTSTMVPDDPYNYEIVVSAHSAGRVLVSDDALTVFAVLDRVGTFRGVFSPNTAGNLVLGMISGTTTNLTITSVKVWKAEVAPTLTTWMTNLAVRRGGLRPEDLNTADLAAIPSPPTFGYYTRDQVLVSDVMQRTMDAMCGFMWQDRFGQIRFRILELPLPGAKPDWVFDDMVLHGDVSRDADQGPGLRPSVNARRNYSPHRDGEVAGSVFVSNPTLAGQLQQPWLINQPVTGLHPTYQADARTRDPMDTMIYNSGAVTVLVTRMRANWGGWRWFYRFEVEMLDGAHEIEPGDICLLNTDRFDLDVLHVGNDGPGQLCVVVSAESKPSSSLVRVSAWGP